MQNKSFTFALLNLLLAVVATPHGSAAEQHGLQGRYYVAELVPWDESLPRVRASKSVVERSEAVDLDWEKNPEDRPATGLFAQWHGSVEASADGAYAFRVETNSQSRLVVDGRLVIDAWGRRIPTTADSLPLQVSKGRRYAVILEYLDRKPRKDKSPSYIRLLWKPPGAAEFTVVPAVALRPEWPATPDGAARTEPPSFQPPSGTLTRPTQVYMATATPDALIRFTTDGSTPTLLHGEIATPGGVTLQSGGKLISCAFKPGWADSEPVIGNYKPGKAEMKKGLVTFHTGNSLMDTVVNGGLQTATRSAGINHTVLKATIPGAPTDFLWGAYSKDPAKPPLAWLKDKAPVDCLITQPFAGHCRSVENELENTGNFFKECRKHSPHAQLWIYQQWSGPDVNDGWARGELALSKADERWKSLPLRAGETIGPGRYHGIMLHREPAKTYDQAVANHRRYFEILRDELRKTFPDQAVPIIPGGQALAALKREMEAGKVPGLRDFFDELYADGIHMSAKGHYLISLVFLSSLYQQSFVGQVTEAGSDLTPEQAKIFQRIAWETVASDPLSSVGLFRKTK
jgi:hypothetical protein